MAWLRCAPASQHGTLQFIYHLLPQCLLVRKHNPFVVETQGISSAMLLHSEWIAPLGRSTNVDIPVVGLTTVHNVTHYVTHIQTNKLPNKKMMSNSPSKIISTNQWILLSCSSLVISRHPSSDCGHRPARATNRLARPLRTQTPRLLIRSQPLFPPGILPHPYRPPQSSEADNDAHQTQALHLIDPHLLVAHYLLFPFFQSPLWIPSSSPRLQ